MKPLFSEEIHSTQKSGNKTDIMGETVTILFNSRTDGTYEVQVKESWSGNTVSGEFLPPYSSKQVSALQKKLNGLDSRDSELRDIGRRLYGALCGNDPKHLEATHPPVQTLLHSVIHRTLKRRGTVALTLCFGPGCEEFVRYPWELLHNGDHFLLVSGIFTLSRALLRPDLPGGCELPVHPPFRVLYISASPHDCAPLETERSFAAMEEALSPLIESGQIFLDRLEPATFSQLVRYLNLYGGAGMLDDSDTTIPCYVVHFDGHGAYGKLCPRDDCRTMNGPDIRLCAHCGAGLTRIKAQTYLCFCDEDGSKRFIDTQSLRGLFLSSDVRLAVFAACETATFTERRKGPSQAHAAVDATLATALVTAQVPAVVAMPFSLQDDLSPTFMYHFYEALAEGRTLEEALSRARQALLPMQQKSWFIPVLYRHVTDGDEGPAPLIMTGDTIGDHGHPLVHLGPPATFVGRGRELKELNDLVLAATGEKRSERSSRPRTAFTHHIAITGSGGIGKSALALEIVRRNREKFQGGIMGLSLQDGKSFADGLGELITTLRIPVRNLPTVDVKQRVRLVQGTLRSLASRELSSLLLIDGFEEISERAELERWLQFLAGLPQEVVVMVTSRSNPEHMLVVDGPHCRWYEYRVGKMAESDLLNLFTELAAASGLDQRIHLDDPHQQRVMREICQLLDGYPLGAELIFGTARSIGGTVYAPEASTRSLEEVRDELRESPLAGILAVLEVSYRRLKPAAALLLSYLSAFKLPFNREQILLLVTAAQQHLQSPQLSRETEPSSSGQQLAQELVKDWRAARDELVQASFMQFDGRGYVIHPQVAHFALAHLPANERRRVHRVVAEYYSHLPQPRPEEWFASFEHLEAAGDSQDLREASNVAVRASWVLAGRGYTLELQQLLRRAAVHASRLKERALEGRIQCRLGAILRQMGQYAEANACLHGSLSLLKQQEECADVPWTLYELARLQLEEGNLQQARKYVQEGQRLFHEMANSKGEGWCQIVLAEIQQECADYVGALELLEQALLNFLQESEGVGLATAWLERGRIFTAQGRYEEAIQEYHEAQAIFTEQGLMSSQAWVQVQQSIAYLALAQRESAEKLVREALTLFREQKFPLGIAYSLGVMGAILVQRSDLMTARACYEEARALFSASGNRIALAWIGNAQGELELAEGEALEARNCYEQARLLAQEHGALRLVCDAFVGLGDVAQEMHATEEADGYYQQAAEIATELKLPLKNRNFLQSQMATAPKPARSVET
ncbi:tetratricopeptide repeat protein [Tengunoibacter tsumagoiensis]|nr:tetratricopeptide repeat protein [Tengunoibacter tsumagoiensis]